MIYIQNQPTGLDAAYKQINFRAILNRTCKRFFSYFHNHKLSRRTNNNGSLSFLTKYINFIYDHTILSNAQY